MRLLPALLAATVLALGAAGCGDDEDDEPAGTATQPATTALSLEDARSAIEQGTQGEPPPARANVLGQTGPIENVLRRLDDDLYEFYVSQLESTGAEVVRPEVQRDAAAGPCDGKTRKATAPPRWCEEENVVLETPAGADAVRQRRNGLARMLVLVAWAHTQGIGEGFGWHDTLGEADVAETEFCMLSGWLLYTYRQRVLEAEDWGPMIETLDNDPAFKKVPPDRANAAFNRGFEGADNCFE